LSVKVDYYINSKYSKINITDKARECTIVFSTQTWSIFKEWEYQNTF
jgi:hypothetical protein